MINESEENVRASLLRYYSQQVVAHAGYILTIIIAMTRAVSVYDVFEEFPAHKIIFSGIMGLLVTLLGYVIGRTIWWAQHLHHILRIKVYSIYKLRSQVKLACDKQKDKLIQYIENYTLHGIMNNTTSDYVKGFDLLTGEPISGKISFLRKFAGWFSGGIGRLWWCIILVAVVVSFLIFLYLSAGA